MDIDEYLKQKKALEEQKKIIEGKEKIHEKKHHHEEKKHHVEQKKEHTDHTSHPKTPHSEGGSNVKTLMIINMVILIGVLAVVAIFYIFPPNFGGTLDDGDKDKQPIQTGGNTKEPVTNQTQKKEEDKTKNDSKDGTTYLGPEFSLTIEDTTEGPFKENGKLQNSGKILSIRGGTFYNDFSLEIQNKESEKIFCEVDRKIDVDTDLDGDLDIEGIYSLNRHGLKMKPVAKEILQAGIESVPGNVKEYQGKGEIWAEYEVRCYFCLDEKCDSYEKRGETKETAGFRVRINDHLLIQDNNNTNKT